MESPTQRGDSSHFVRMNRLSNCIQQFVQTIPVDDDLPEELAHTLQSIYRDRAMEVTQRSIEDWLLRVSQTYGVDCEWLEGDWEQYNQVTVSKRTAYQREEDQDDQDDQDEMDMDASYPVEKRLKSLSVSPSHPKDKCVSEKKRMVKIVTRWNAALGRFVHLETGMVFVSKQEPKVFAHWDGEEMHRLSSDDLEVCRLYRFQVAPDRFESYVTPRAHEAAESSFALDPS